LRRFFVRQIKLPQLVDTDTLQAEAFSRLPMLLFLRRLTPSRARCHFSFAHNPAMSLPHEKNFSLDLGGWIRIVAADLNNKVLAKIKNSIFSF